MDINIDSDYRGNHLSSLYNHTQFNRNSPNSNANIILQKIFKYTAILVGIGVALLILLDLCEKILKTYNEMDDSSWEGFRSLEEPEENPESIPQKNVTYHNISDVGDEEKIQIELDIVDINGRVIEKYIIKGTQKEIDEFQALIKEKHEINRKINEFTKSVSGKNFLGSRQSETVIPFLSNRKEGQVSFHMEKLKTLFSRDEKLWMMLKLYDGKFNDRWIVTRSMKYMHSNVTITNTSITHRWESYVNFGEIFDRVDPTDGAHSLCTSTLFLDWSSNIPKHEREINQEDDIIDKTDNFQLNITDLLGNFTSNCGFSNFTFNLKLNPEHELSSKIFYYSLIVTLLAISQIFNSMWIIKKLSDSQSYSNSISLATVLQNIVWNCYGCYSHFIMAVNYDVRSFYFGVPALCYFINFSIFELRLLYNIWRVKNLRYFNDQVMLRKKLVQFYFIFFIVMFCSFFYLTKFYYHKSYILFAILLTWIPQMIYNTCYKNRLSLPILSIFMISINRVFLPFYFRGCPENFFKLSSDSSFVSACTICLLLELIFLYSQTLFGPRWFLPKIWSQPSFNFYKTKNEILQIRPDAEFNDCVICLFSMFNSENLRHFSDDFISAAGITDESYTSIKNSNSFFKFCKTLCLCLTEFHSSDLTLNKKPFMMTPCRHYFHTQCLENWFKEKKECPSCRQEINDPTV